jgi:hypothetical protein
MLKLDTYWIGSTSLDPLPFRCEKDKDEQDA